MVPFSFPPLRLSIWESFADTKALNIFGAFNEDLNFQIIFFPSEMYLMGKQIFLYHLKGKILEKAYLFMNIKKINVNMKTKNGLEKCLLEFLGGGLGVKVI